MSGPPEDSTRRRQIPIDAVAASTPAASGADADAASEAAAMAAGKLDQESRYREHTRTERIRDHVSRAAICVVWLLFLLYATAFLVLAWHYLAPHRSGMAG